eukprot:3759063-Pleurochrysis_carterae.AAC.1
MHSTVAVFDVVLSFCAMSSLSLRIGCPLGVVESVDASVLSKEPGCGELAAQSLEQLCVQRHFVRLSIDPAQEITRGRRVRTHSTLAGFFCRQLHSAFTLPFQRRGTSLAFGVFLLFEWKT